MSITGTRRPISGGAPDARPEARGAGNWTWKLFFAPPGSPSSASRSRATRTVAVYAYATLELFTTTQGAKVALGTSGVNMKLKR
jgi:hypothetical protein